jgi:NAD(P)-dependent dehydrogenase (short-subunit alcohol dehydrogenase family)
MRTRALNGQVIAITGGARGIGRATAQSLIARGARVAIGDVDVPVAEETAAQLGGGTLALELDVTERDSFAAFLDATEEQLGPLDGLVNNAGVMPIRAFATEDDVVARRIIDINVHGVILGSKLALERMLPRGGGHIVNVASQAGRIGAPGLATYCASKFAVVGLCDALRAELRDTGVTVSCVMPAVVNTELISGIEEAPRILRIEPEDVAEAIAASFSNHRAEIYVPRILTPAYRAGAVLTPRLRDALLRGFGADHIIADAENSPERAAYDARAAGSEQTTKT